MNMTTVTGSSQVAAHGYDASSQELVIKFHSGQSYSYAGVPQTVYDDLCTSKSIGSFLHTHIKGTYKHTQQGAAHGQR